MINYMVRPSVHNQMAKVIGGTLRITTRMDMGQARALIEGDTRGDGMKVMVMGMEYSHGQMEECIMENINRTREMVMAV